MRGSSLLSRETRCAVESCFAIQSRSYNLPPCSKGQFFRDRAGRGQQRAPDGARLRDRGDFNYDGVVNTADFTAFSKNFNQVVPSALRGSQRFRKKHASPIRNKV
jgi:hypothetical protein